MVRPIVVEQQNIDVMAAHVDAGSARQLIASVDPQARIDVGRLLYYPYFHFAASCNVKSIFVPRAIPAQCLVDGSRGVAATADGFEASKKTVSAEAIINAQISPDEAERQARRYLGHALGKKTRSIANFEIDLKSRGVVYKGFWLATCGEYAFVVDSVTGHLHTIRRAA